MAIKVGGAVRDIEEMSPAAAADADDEDDQQALPSGELYAPGGEWTRTAARRFFADCPKRGVSIPRDDQNDKAGKPAYHQVIWNGLVYPVLKGRVQMVPAPIAEIVERMQEELRTAQAQNMAHLIRDIGDGQGPEIVLAR